MKTIDELAMELVLHNESRPKSWENSDQRHDWLDRRYKLQQQMLGRIGNEHTAAAVERARQTLRLVKPS